MYMIISVVVAVLSRWARMSEQQFPERAALTTDLIDILASHKCLKVNLVRANSEWLGMALTLHTWKNTTPWSLNNRRKMEHDRNGSSLILAIDNRFCHTVQWGILRHDNRALS